jgi:hypothetical protein
LQRLVRKVKHRVSTDDSIEASELGATEGVPQSRNNGMDRGDWDEAALPSIQTLGEAVAVVKSVARDMGFVATQVVFERIALWALDSPTPIGRSRSTAQIGGCNSSSGLTGCVWTSAAYSGRRTCLGCSSVCPRSCSQSRCIGCGSTTSSTLTVLRDRRGRLGERSTQRARMRMTPRSHRSTWTTGVA